MSALNRTPTELICDPQGRPYFLWDIDMTLVKFCDLLVTGDVDTQSYLIAKLMRQAKPDDVFTFVSLDRIRDLMQAIAPQLGNKREFWQWVLDTWDTAQRAA